MVGEHSIAWLETAMTVGGFMIAMVAGALIVVMRSETRATSPRSPSEDPAPARLPLNPSPQEAYVEPHDFSVDRAKRIPLIRRHLVSRGVKRVADVLLSLALLIFTLPVLLIVSIAVKTGSAGPIFYRQSRLGRDGKLFSILKFRTMRTDAEANGPKWAAKGDSRITKVGRFLRKTRIDEIPQAINILAGDMSFVGPRPERPEFSAELEQRIPNFAARLMVKPGLTGWAQVNLAYAASVEDTRVKLAYDLYYIENYSLWLDIKIVFRTVWVALFSDSAH